jgi:hypothetical protein
LNMTPKIKAAELAHALGTIARARVVKKVT